ncbi:uncharacterized protein CDAR_291271 [Caerostris darwini]|uniref:Uncharacterized protein n=1 Tax=Caerostris darwini TaxID=1538125 RepID=A0AAV4RJ58_9ARAC|nr:uncharacterized protein CDAR_291271 [Caerostris darwini]
MKVVRIVGDLERSFKKWRSEEIELFEVNETGKTKIDIEHIRDNIRIEIKKKVSDWILKTNGHGPLKRKSDSDDDGSLHSKMKNCKVDDTNKMRLRSAFPRTARLAASEEMDIIVPVDMSKTFQKRRNFILSKNPSVLLVKEKYPDLFSCAGVQNELDRIFFAGKCKRFISNIEKFTPHILSIAKENDPLILTTMRKVKLYQIPMQKKYAQEVGAILFCSSISNETSSFLKLANNDFEISDFPYLECDATEDELFLNEHPFKVFVEGIRLCEAENLKEAILCLVASYFIFNIKYPVSSFCSLVMFEKLFLEASDTDEEEIELHAMQIIKWIKLKCHYMLN